MGTYEQRSDHSYVDTSRTNAAYELESEPMYSDVLQDGEMYEQRSEASGGGAVYVAPKPSAQSHKADGSQQEVYGESGIVNGVDGHDQLYVNTSGSASNPTPTPKPKPK